MTTKHNLISPAELASALSRGDTITVIDVRSPFDRTRWNVIYGSGKFFSNLGMHLVNDLVELHVRIVTEEP